MTAPTSTGASTRPDTDRLSRQLIGRGYRPLWLTTYGSSSKDPVQHAYDFICITRDHEQPDTQSLLAYQLVSVQDGPNTHYLRSDIYYVTVTCGVAIAAPVVDLPEKLPYEEIASAGSLSLIGLRDYISDYWAANGGQLRTTALHYDGEYVPSDTSLVPAIRRALQGADRAGLIDWTRLRTGLTQLLDSIRFPSNTALALLRRRMSPVDYPVGDALNEDRCWVLTQIMLGLFERMGYIG